MKFAREVGDRTAIVAGKCPGDRSVQPDIRLESPGIGGVGFWAAYDFGQLHEAYIVRLIVRHNLLGILVLPSLLLRIRVVPACLGMIRHTVTGTQDGHDVVDGN